MFIYLFVFKGYDQVDPSDCSQLFLADKATEKPGFCLSC